MSQHVSVRAEIWSPSPAPQPAAGCSCFSNRSPRSWPGGLTTHSQTSSSALSSCHPHSPAPLWQPARFSCTGAACKNSHSRSPRTCFLPWPLNQGAFCQGKVKGKCRCQSRRGVGMRTNSTSFFCVTSVFSMLCSKKCQNSCHIPMSQQAERTAAHREHTSITSCSGCERPGLADGT